MVDFEAFVALSPIYTLWLRPCSRLMTSSTLFLYSRNGCCLCKGLEERLRSLDITQIRPCLILKVIDIDDGQTPDDVRERYQFEVPVLAMELSGRNQVVALPRVSPRLNGEGLFNWLQKACNQELRSD
mgnify:CR=1 FL=1